MVAYDAMVYKEILKITSFLTMRMHKSIHAVVRYFNAVRTDSRFKLWIQNGFGELLIKGWRLQYTKQHTHTQVCTRDGQTYHIQRTGEKDCRLVSNPYFCMSGCRRGSSFPAIRYRLPANSIIPFSLTKKPESLYPHAFHFITSCL